jgi:hypothetical protein
MCYSRYCQIREYQGPIIGVLTDTGVGQPKDGGVKGC